MPEPKSYRRFAPLGCAIGAAVALVAFVYLAVHGDQAGTAASAATLCLALAVLGALDLESFEGLGIKAKLRSTLSDAEERLRAINDMAVSLARASLNQAANGTVEFEDAKQTVSNITASLETMGLSRLQIDNMKQTFYTGILGYHWLYISDVYNNYMLHVEDLPGFSVDDLREGRKLPADAQSWLRHGLVRWPLYDATQPVDQFERTLLDSCEAAPVQEEGDREALRILGRYLSRSAKRCISEGNYTTEAIRFLKYHEPPNDAELKSALTKLSPEKDANLLT